MHTIPKRPTREDLKAQVLKEYLALNEEESKIAVLPARKLDWNAETILQYLADDGFDLMLELQDNEGWELSREVLDELDGYVNSVTRTVIEATREWMKEYDVLSRALPAGTTVKIKGHNIIGTIEGVKDSEYWDLASYEVSHPSLEASHYIVKFEDVEALPQQ